MNEKLFKFILKCQRNHYKPDVHTFWIDINGGRAYVECRQNEVFVQSHTGGFVKEWCGTAVAATNRLERLDAVYETIDM